MIHTGATASRRRATPSSAACSRICPRSSASRRQASTRTDGSSRASGRARTRPGAWTIARRPWIERKLDPGEPTLVDPDTLSDAERKRRGIRRLPATLGEALDALEKDEALRAALGEVLGREYLVVKRSEVRGFEGKDVDFEIEHHFYKY